MRLKFKYIFIQNYSEVKKNVHHKNRKTGKRISIDGIFGRDVISIHNIRIRINILIRVTPIYFIQGVVYLKGTPKLYEKVSFGIHEVA